MPGARAADLAAIPSLPSHHVERAEALGELHELIAADRCVVMSGLPGVGKTSLAAALARERSPDGAVCWVTLTAGITTPAEAVIRLLARFLVRHGHDEAAPVSDQGQVEHPLPLDEQLYLITRALSQAGALVCLDNAHLLRDEPQTQMVIEHLAGSSPASFLAASREDLPLAGFTPFRLGGLASGEARELVGELAGPLMSGPLTDTLIKRTGGSPMLIRLALGQLRPGGPGAATLVERLEAEPRVVSYLLRATLGDLSGPSRRLISLIAVFRHPVDLLDERLIEASESLGGRYDVLAGLDELRRRQLVDHPARADLHPLVRDYCYASLVGAAAGRRDLHRLAAAHCERVLDDPLEASWHYLRAQDPDEAADLLATRAADLIASGRSGRAADLAGELLAAADVTGDTERLLLIARGDLLLHTERAGEAEDAYREALARPAPQPVRAGIAWRLAQSLLQRGKVPEALELCRSTAAGLTGDEEVLRAQLGAVRSRAHLMLSEFGEAVSVAEEACAAAAGSGPPKREAGAGTAFADEVRADARHRGLIRSRIGPGTLVLLAAAGIPGAVLATMALARHQQSFYLATPALVYLIILRAPWALYRRTRLTRAGQEALAAWLGFRLALIGSRSGPTAGTALLAVGGDRRIAYAAALGAAPDAVAAFSAAADRDRVWSSFGGSWHRVVVGKARHRYVPGTAALAGSAALCGLFAILTLVILSEFGLKWAAVFLVFPGCIWWGGTLLVFGCSARGARRPALAEFDGQILKMWTENVPGDDNTPSHTRYCVAIDDGIREQAWALDVGHQVYAASRAGLLVHVRVDPRRNELLAMSVLASGDDPPDPPRAIPHPPPTSPSLSNPPSRPPAGRRG